MFANPFKDRLPAPDEALAGRDAPIATAERHHVLNTGLAGPYPQGAQIADVAMGCFWGAERVFWTLEGVFVTAVGYQGGLTPNPTYAEVCSGRTGHAEVVRIVFDPTKVSYAQILKAFWENHDPTQGNRQGADKGTQYRSAIYTHSDEQARTAAETRDMFQTELNTRGFGDITTEIRNAPEFYFAESDHQQYLSKNPGGYCGLGGTGATCPIGVATTAS